MIIAGVDEAGRGPLAGPIVAAAVILPGDWSIPLRDSKKHTPKQRLELFNEITPGSQALGISWLASEEIDTIGIQEANKRVMEWALEELLEDIVPDEVIVDGTIQLENCREIAIRSEAKADERYPCVSAASIVAKVMRDIMMEIANCSFPQYGFKDHKGYYCKQHIDAIRKYGLSPLHRRSFRIRELEGETIGTATGSPKTYVFKEGS